EVAKEHGSAKPFSQPIACRRSKTCYEKAVRPEPCRDTPNKGRMLVPRNMGNGVERRYGVKRSRGELNGSHIRVNKGCFRNIPSGAHDLPKRCVNTGHLEATGDEFPFNRLARTAPKIKHRRPCRERLE